MGDPMAPSEREGGAVPAESRAVRRSGRASPVRDSLKRVPLTERENERKGTNDPLIRFGCGQGPALQSDLEGKSRRSCGDG